MDGYRISSFRTQMGVPCLPVWNWFNYLRFFFFFHLRNFYRTMETYSWPSNNSVGLSNQLCEQIRTCMSYMYTGPPGYREYTGRPPLTICHLGLLHQYYTRALLINDERKKKLLIFFRKWVSPYLSFPSK